MEKFTAPKTLKENQILRYKIVDRAKKDAQLQTLIKEQCRRDTVFFIDTFAWAHDPRKADSVSPFILYPRQEQLIRLLDEWLAMSQKGEKINVVIDKPRDVGATYTVMLWILHKYLFTDFNSRIGSRKEDYVDMKGETDTLFHKLDFNLDLLPKWLRGEHTRNSMMLSNNANSNQISGESSNVNFGRGGRKSCILFDELGFWEDARSSWESAGESTNMRIAMSTPPESGKDSHFYKLLTNQRGKVYKFEFNYQDVPGRTEQWLAQQREAKSEEEFSREILKSFEGSTENKVYGVALRHALINNCDYDPQLPLFIAWDFGLDQTPLIWLQKDFNTNRVYIIDSYHNANIDIDFYVPFVTGIVQSGIHTYTDYELAKIELHKAWSKTITHFGDPDVEKRNVATLISTRQQLMKHGIYIQTKTGVANEWKTRREATSLLFRRLEINEQRNEYLLSALHSAAYPKRGEATQSTQGIVKPIHNWSSHFRSSLEYFAVNEPKSWHTESRFVAQNRPLTGMKRFEI